MPPYPSSSPLFRRSLIVGTSVAAAFVSAYRMERACAMQLAFQQSGATFHPITDEVVSAAHNRPTGGRSEPAKFEWPALLRKLDRIESLPVFLAPVWRGQDEPFNPLSKLARPERSRTPNPQIRGPVAGSGSATAPG
jgi:hypothetical protein